MCRLLSLEETSCRPTIFGFSTPFQYFLKSAIVPDPSLWHEAQGHAGVLPKIREAKLVPRSCSGTRDIDVWKMSNVSTSFLEVVCFSRVHFSKYGMRR